MASGQGSHWLIESPIYLHLCVAVTQSVDNLLCVITAASFKSETRKLFRLTG